MKLMHKSDRITSPCTKSELVDAIKCCPSFDIYKTPKVERLSRNALIDLAHSLEVLDALEERTEIIRILCSAKVRFDSTSSTFKLISEAVDVALDRYGIADLEALAKNLKNSPFLKKRSIRKLPVEKDLGSRVFYFRKPNAVVK